MNAWWDTLLVAVCLMASGWVMRMMYELGKENER